MAVIDKEKGIALMRVLMVNSRTKTRGVIIPKHFCNMMDIESKDTVRMEMDSEGKSIRLTKVETG